MGIIYRAFNKITGKSYIGQTTRTLEIRKQDHYHNINRYCYKFPNALRKYKKEDWEWIVLTKIEDNKLDEYEQYYIKLFDSYKNGYNSCENHQHECSNISKLLIKNKPKYKLYHPEVGVIEESLAELCKRYIGFSKCIQRLVKGNIKHINGYVLFDNKDKYDVFLNLHEFYNPKYGIIKCTPTQLDKDYLKITRRKDLKAYQLVNENIVMYHGWVLSKHKNIYNHINNINKKKCRITLNHPRYGTLCLRMFEFYEKYNLLISDIQKLKRKEIYVINDWKLNS